MVDSIQYRKDVDGLRAIAVLAVILYHVFPNFLQGGFVGVDVFFVISGFLISGLILDAVEKGDFSFTDFYARRIRRIFPSMLIIFAFCLFFGSFILYSQEYMELAKSVLYGSLFWSNNFLYKQTGYFDNARELKGLLHFWSLGVEEQFYIFWPMLLVFLRGKTSKLVIGFLVLASFACNVYFVKVNGAADFYLTYFRIWELALGWVLAIELRKPAVARPQLNRNLVSLLGFVALILSLLLVSEKDFPGLKALWPTMATVLLIWSGREAWINRMILSHPVAVFIGLISYPLYLWHWPLLYFLRMLTAGEPPAEFKILAMVLAFLLAWACYRFIEIPVRRGIVRPRSAVRLLVILNLLFCVSSSVIAKKGNTNPLPASLQLRYQLGDKVKTCSQASCEQDVREPATRAIIGDSHADSLYPGLLANSKPGERWEHLFMYCLDDFNPMGSRACQHSDAEAITKLRQDTNVNLVVISMATRILSSHAPLLKGEQTRTRVPAQNVVQNLSGLIRLLQDAGKKVAFVVDWPGITFSPERCVPRPVSFGEKTNPECTLNRHVYEDSIKEYSGLVAGLKSTFPKILFFDSINFFCDQDVCRVIHEGKSYYSYSDHISDVSNNILGKALIEKLSQSL